MPYRQYTQCTSTSNYIGSAAVNVIIGAAIGALPLILSLAFSSIALGPAALAALTIPLLAFIAYCRWWLYGRLICLGGDVCAVARLLTVEPPENKSGLDRIDTDYSLNLLLAPHAIGDDQSTIESDGIQGNLIKDQPSIIAAGLGFTGQTAALPGDPQSAIFHAEFEGGGVYDMLLSLLAALGYNTVATIAAVIICAIPVIGWIACLIISAIFAAITAGLVGVGIANALNDTANPGDVNSHLGNLEQGKDILVVKGAWVYDSAHSGWNEIHPIKQCQRIGTWDEANGWDGLLDTLPASATKDIPTLVKFWCDALATATSPLTAAAQAQPQNQWNIHPLVDGCDPGNSDPPPPQLQ